MIKVGIGYAAYITNDLHFKYAQETLESIQSKKYKLQYYGVVNSKYITEECEQYLTSYGPILYNSENNVSMAWNRATKALLDRGCKYVIVPNLDIVFKSNMVDNLVDYAESHPEHMVWTALPWGELESLEQALEYDNAPETPHFSCFMVDERLAKVVGDFDTNFRPAYNEDLDMHWRIKLSGNTAVGYEGARFYHHGSRTIHSDPLLLRANAVTHDANNRYFIEKWGDKPPTAADPFLTSKMYRTPFNNVE